MNIIIVDDDRQAAEVLKKKLTEYHEMNVVGMAHDGKEGLQLFKEAMPALSGTRRIASRQPLPRNNVYCTQPIYAIGVSQQGFRLSDETYQRRRATHHHPPCVLGQQRTTAHTVCRKHSYRSDNNRRRYITTQ